MQISVSALRTYLSCSHRWQLRYIEHADREFSTAAMIFGEAIHYAIAEQLQSGHALDEAALYRRFAQFWEARLEDETRNGREVRFGSLETDTLTQQAKDLLRIFCEQFSQIVATDVEVFFEVPLFDPVSGVGNPDHSLIGRVDCIAADGSIWEFKTSSRSPSVHDVNSNVQVTAYWLAHTVLYDVAPERCYIATGTRTKVPKWNVLETSRSEASVRRFVEMACSVIDAIDAGVFVRNLEPQYGCGTCEFRSRCFGSF